MSTLENYIPFVKYQARRVESILKKHSNDQSAQNSLPKIAEQFRETVRVMESAASELAELRQENEELRSRLGNRHQSAVRSFSLTADDIKDIPQELFSQLNITESDQQEFKILEIIEEAGGVMSLDKMLVAYFRATGEVLERSKLNQRLYRMTNKGMLYSVPSRKGLYSTREVPQEQLD